MQRSQRLDELDPFAAARVTAPENKSFVPGHQWRHDAFNGVKDTGYSGRDDWVEKGRLRARRTGVRSTESPDIRVGENDIEHAG